MPFKIPLFILILVSLLISPVCCLAETDWRDIDPYYEPRYLVDYSPSFFKKGGERVRFNRNIHLRIGIVIRNKSKLSLNEIISVIFSVSPFDRYRDFFVFVEKRDIEKAKRVGAYYIKAYNSYGAVVPGGYDVSSSSVRAGLVVLNVDDPIFNSTGTLGYATKKLAVAQKMTILHELAHVLGGLADEYSIDLGSKRNKDKEKVQQSIGIPVEYHKHKIWFTDQPNLDYRTRDFLKWQPLVDSGIIPDNRIPRVQLVEGEDKGRFLIPTKRCIMNRIIGEEMSFCPVCQLQLIESICRHTGAFAPWDE